MNSIKRTEASLAFQARWSELRPAGVLIPKSTDIELTHFAEFLPLLIKAEVDLKSRTMPIRLVGSLIRDIVGLELTGTDYLDIVEGGHTEASWQSRLLVHDQPCGRYEVVTMRFPGEVNLSGSLTTLPLIGSASERFFLAFGEPMDKPPHLDGNQTGGAITKTNDDVFIDIGGGIPES